MSERLLYLQNFGCQMNDYDVGRIIEVMRKEGYALTPTPKDADLVGTSQRVIQAAVDHVARLGGGTVKLLPGTYRLRNAVTLASHVRLLGCGAGTVLVKEPSHASKLAADSD